MTYPEPRYLGANGEQSATYESGEPAAMLVHFAPGAPRKGYFEGLAEFGVRGRPSKEDLAAFYLRHDTFWL